MTKTFNFGKIDFNHSGRKINLVEIEFGFRELTNQEPYFTSVASVWNSKHTDIVCGGQCLDDLFNEFKSLRHNRLFNECYSIWSKYHLKKISELPEEIIAEINNILENGEEDNIYVKY